MAADGENSGDGSNIAIGQIVLGAVFGIIVGVLASHFVKPPPPRAAAPAPAATERRTHYHYATNGVKDEEWLYQSGRLAVHKVDRNLDGSYDYWALYDSDGKVYKVEEDNNFDGKPDETWTYSNSDIAGMEKDTDFNGVPDEFYTYKFHLPAQLDIRPNGSKFATVRVFFSNGVTTAIWRGGDINGNFREKVSYDPFFNPIETNAQYFPLLTVPGH